MSHSCRKSGKIAVEWHEIVRIVRYDRAWVSFYPRSASEDPVLSQNVWCSHSKQTTIDGALTCNSFIAYSMA
jgi:hypothetical protein